MASPGSTNVIIITGDPAPYYATLQAVTSASNTAAASISSRFTSVGKSLTSVGKSMTKYVSLPLLAVGAASAKLAVDFEESFTRIRANSNLTGKEIDHLRKVVLQLSGKTAQSPKELADGLYFLASAGLSAAQVEDTLTQAAKASAAGFGDVADVAKLTANALNAYAKDGLTARKVTDSLAAAIREGTAEPDAFANALGRILPFAQKAGVGFDEVTASLASLSNIGIDVNEGVTSMRGLLSALISPTEQARDAMKEYGLSADGLRQSLADDGLLATMRLLEDRTNGNIDAQRKIIPNIRALAGLFGITGQKADKVNDSFHRVMDSTGDLDKAFDKTRKGPAFKFQQMLADFQRLGIKLGEALLPTLLDVADGVEGILKSFERLSPELRQGIVKWGLYAIALGPVLRILGSISSLAGRLTRTLPAATSAAGGVSAGAGGLGGTGIPAGVVGLLAGANAFLDTKINDNLKEMQRNAGLADNAFASFGRRLSVMATGPLGGAVTAFDDFRQSMSKGKGVIGSVVDALNPFNDAVEQTHDKTTKVERRIKTLTEALPKLGGHLSDAEKYTIDAYIAAGHYDLALELLQGEVDKAGGKFEHLRDGINDAAGATADHSQKVQALKSALEHVPNRTKARIETPGMSEAQANARTFLDTILSIPHNVVVHSSFSGTPQQRAVGGPVLAGHDYIVGERGPELLRMGTGGGWVHPNNASQGLNGAGVVISGPVELIVGEQRMAGYIRSVAADGFRRDVRHWVGN